MGRSNCSLQVASGNVMDLSDVPAQSHEPRQAEPIQVGDGQILVLGRLSSRILDM